MASAATGTELANVRAWLLDAGPLVAYLDSRDPSHGAVASSLDEYSGQPLTTSAVITEAMHCVSACRGGARLLAGFVEASGTEVYPECAADPNRAPESRMAHVGPARGTRSTWLTPKPLWQRLGAGEQNASCPSRTLDSHP